MSEIDVAAESQRWFNRPWFRDFLGAYVIGSYLRLTVATSKVVYDPPDLHRRLAALEPALYMSWHGNASLGFLLVPHPEKTDLLASLHPDGRMVAALARSMRFGVIDGSGMNFRQKEGTGGVAAYRAMTRALNAGRSLYMTADIPPIPGRNVSRGVILLARRSGRPLVPIATAASRRTVLDRTWDKFQITHPFSRLGIVAGEPYYVGEESDDEAAEAFAARLHATLARAFAVADGVA